MAKKYLFFLVWTVIILLGPLTVIQNSLRLNPGNQIIIDLNFVQRLTGIIAFELIFIQIVLGASMNFWTNKFGGWVYTFHTRYEGSLAYLLILTHKLDPFSIFPQFCFLCKTKTELYLTLGRASFWLITLAVVAAKFRGLTPWLRKNWRGLHILNYLVFFLVAFHSWNLGSDASYVPFRYFYFLSLPIVTTIVLVKLFHFFKVVVPENISRGS